MVTIEVLLQEDTTEAESIIKEKIKIEGIHPLRIFPVNIKINIPIPMAELPDLIVEIEPIEGPQQDELDSYYANRIPGYNDGDLSRKELDLPHHIGLRLALESILQKYGTSGDLQILIS